MRRATAFGIIVPFWLIAKRCMAVVVVAAAVFGARNVRRARQLRVAC